MKRSRVRVNLLVILTILMCFPCTSIGDTDISLYPIHVNGTWGFINEQGVIVIPPQYVDVLPFSGMFTGSSCDGKNWGIIDADAVVNKNWTRNFRNLTTDSHILDCRLE